MLAIHEKLHAHEAVEEEHAKRAKKERDGAADPVDAIAAVGVGPASASVGRKIGPGEGVREKGDGVEEVSAEGGHEQERG